ncbi:hypothetical protein BKA56DRAFT_231914 [Ilyonectria sp. MPI-CAGE-AT-0026]|nr:hypothetical protein BKA56DRAFT_231914 [Ilyonectria sp. MPI-CAGE-AT-0026]
MEWIEALMRRHFAERSPRTAQYTKEFARDLGIGRTRDEHHLMFTSKGSFVRPFCREVKTERDAMNGRYIAAFVPYLHYEKHRDFQAMADTVAEAIDAWPDMSDGTTGMIRDGEGSVKSKKKRPSKHTEKPASARYKPGPPGTQQKKKRTKDNKNGRPTSDNASIDTSYKGIPPGILHKMLIQGYLKSGAGGEVPPLQIRRTLDHYFYSHLDNTSKRDSDQVVQRYTSKIMDMEPKMFMVDQLWLWILDNDTVISCCPMRWDSWETDPQAKPKSNTRPGDPSGNRPMTGEDFAVRENDPLNIYQAIAEYMSKIRRDSIQNVEDLCRIITSSCLNAFDPHRVPEEFHFFDFMERSIGDVIEQTTERFEEFQVMLDTAAATNDLLSAVSIRIEAETNLLVEIEDIRDELGILRLVIEDQKFVIDDLEKILSPDSDEAFHPAHVRKDHILKDNRVLESHFARIKRMEGLTARAIQSLRSLLKLKQQHASLSEAHSARRLAEYNTDQARLATSYNKLVADQLTMAGKQAEQTAKQANVLLLFTVVTAVFLPLSFMTSFFTIEIASFPVNESGKMAMSYVLPIILSVSAGVSIPFILIAFNLDKVAAWPRKFYDAIKDGYEITTFMTIVCLVIFISLAVVLSQPLAAPIKGSIGATLGLLISVVLIAILIWKKGRHWL